MDAATFRWKPNRPVYGAILAVGVLAYLALIRPLLPYGWAFGLALSFMTVLFGPLYDALFDKRLRFDEEGVALVVRSKEVWRIAWPELQSVSDERDTPREGWSRLVLRSADGGQTRRLVSGPPGRWEDPAALTAALRTRGHAL